MIRGRPIHFLATMVGGWTTMRVVTILPWPATLWDPLPAFVEKGVTPRVVAQIGQIGMEVLLPLPARAAERMAEQGNALPSPGAVRFRPERSTRISHERPIARSMVPNGVDIHSAGTSGWSSAIADNLPEAGPAFVHIHPPRLALVRFTPGVGLSPGEAGAPLGHSSSGRWSGVAWMIGRRNADPGRALLGGSQAGVRVDYALSPSSSFRPTLYGRVSGALRGVAGAEIAAGLAIRPTLPFPAIIAVERRQAVSPGGRSDFAVLAAGGLNPTPVGHGFRLDGYGQAGFVGTDRRDAFADGRLTLERPVGGVASGGIGRGFAIGAAIWGGAQPGTSRLDIGPQANARVRLGGATMRIGAEWRAQVAGNASPSSGPAFSIGADF